MADTGDAAKATIVHNSHVILILWRNGQEKKKRYGSGSSFNVDVHYCQRFSREERLSPPNDDFGCRVTREDVQSFHGTVYSYWTI